MRTAAALLLLVGLAACQHTGGPSIASATTIRGACGAIRPWSAGWQARLAAYLRSIPRDHIARELAKDAIDARDAVRICRQEMRR